MVCSARPEASFAASAGNTRYRRRRKLASFSLSDITHPAIDSFPQALSGGGLRWRRDRHHKLAGIEHLRAALA